MKKTLALILAFAMVFSTITVAFAEEVAEVVAEEAAVVSDEAKALATIGMLEGSGEGVTAEYTATELNRLTAAIMILKLKGLYEEAKVYEGENNFVDAEEVVWPEGKKVLAYVKDNPVGFGGNEKGEFMPYDTLSEQMFYKVLLENLGYKQVTADVADGDFAWEETLEFAESLGLKPAKAEKFTVDGLSKAVVAALKTNMKDGKAWIEVLVENEKVDEAKAVLAGLMEEVPALAAALKSAKALGNTVVEVKFDAEINEGAANVDLYAIEGLEVKSAVVAGEKVVRLETAAMTKGKVYKLTVGEKTVKFTGVPKVSGGPDIDKVVGEDVEEVVITFNKKIDLEAGTNVDNFSISGVEIVKAEVDGDEVTLTTDGLKNKTKYTVKVTNMKSVDGATKKATSKSFTTKYDLIAPKIKDDIEVQTNQRIVVYFTEKVTQESAEDLENYSIKINKTDGEELEILSITWDDDDENNVEIVTEAMENRKEYKITINNIADQRKVANVITRPSSKTFKGIDEDKYAPKWERLTVLSPTTILIEFSDASKLDEESVLDLNNYTLKDLEIEEIETITNKWKVFKALLTVEEMETGKNYELKISDILDEFGNAMKETKKTAKALSGEFASAKIYNVKATGKNKVELVFTKEVDKATAEDLSNYEINKGVGAPTKAELQSDKKTVKLDVNDLINSEANYHKITVDGVEDLAGNILYYKDYVIDTWTEVWDEDAPVLENAETLNKYVVALTFDEKVKFETGATLVLGKGISNITELAPANTVELTAKDYADDNTVVEFSAADPELEAGERYTVVRVVYGGVDGGIKDYRGNRIFEADIEFGDFEFEGVEEAEDPAEIETYEQINGVAFKVTMSREVDFATGKGSDSEAGWTITIKDDKITFTKDSKIDEVDYEFTFSDLFVDKHGFAVADDYERKVSGVTEKYSILAGEYKDEDAPYIDEVVAKDRETIKVVFNEDVLPNGTAVGQFDYDGIFTLKNYDLDKKISITGINRDGDDHNILELTVDKPLEARYEYELTLVKDAQVKDVAGNKEKGDEQSFYFQGTNLAK